MLSRTRIGLAITAALLAGIAPGCGAKPASNNSGRIVYAVDSSNGSKQAGLFLVDADGKHRTRLTPEQPLRTTEAHWSPVGDTILVSTWTRTNGEIWTINADGSGARQIGEGLSASWSPDGREVAVVTSKNELEILSADGDRLRTIGDSIREAPSWSPDGRTLAFIGADDALYVAPAGGTGRPRRVTTGLADLSSDANPVWSPDGERLAFTRTSPEDPWEAWTSRADGSDLRLVAHDVTVVGWSNDGASLIGDDFNRYPLDGREPRPISKEEALHAQARDRVSPDGERMVTVQETGRLVVSRLDGSSPKQLTEPVAYWCPVWAPDGVEIAFLSHSGADVEELGQVGVIGANGQGERRLGAKFPSGPTAWCPLQWSPAGTALLLDTGSEGSLEAAVMSLETGHVRAIPDSDGAGAWSPDGSKIAVVVARYRGADEAGHYSVRSTLYALQADSTGRRRLAENRGGEDTAVFNSPVWTPDGLSILVAETNPDEENPRILQVPVNGDRSRTIVRYVSNLYDAPAIDPDGKLVAFASARGIETVSLASGDRAVVVSDPPNVVALAWSPDGKELAYLVMSEEASSRLYVVERDGSNRRMISKPGESVDSFDWRPQAAQD